MSSSPSCHRPILQSPEGSSPRGAANGPSRALWAGTIIALASALAEPATAQSLSTRPTAGRSLPELEVHVISFNIRYGTAQDGEDAWLHRRQQVFDLLEGQAADIVGLQEALRFQLDELRAALPRYGVVGVGRDDGEGAGEFSAILYRTDRFELEDSGTFWLSDQPEVVASKTWGNETTRICTWALLEARSLGQRLYVFNAHLDHQSQPSREKALQLIARRMAARSKIAPALLIGDFNADEENPAVRWLLGPRAVGAPSPAAAPPPLRLVDSFRVRHPDEKDVRTFHAFRGGASGEKIDYILVPPWCFVREAAILRSSRDGRYPSDHYPVSARILLPCGGDL